MITLLRRIVTFHGPLRLSHRANDGRSSMTAPIDQIAPSRKQTVGGYAFDTGSTSVPSRLFGYAPIPGNHSKRTFPNSLQNGGFVSTTSPPSPTATIAQKKPLDMRAKVPSA